jgi:hypothetical protein
MHKEEHRTGKINTQQNSKNIQLKSKSMTHIDILNKLLILKEIGTQYNRNLTTATVEIQEKPQIRWNRPIFSYKSVPKCKVHIRRSKSKGK